MDEFDGGAVAAVGILSTLQHTGVTALKAEGEDVERHVGTGLVDHTDDTERHTDATKAQPVRQRLLLGDVSEGRRQRGYVAHVGSDVLQSAVGQLQAVVQRVLAIHLRQVLGIGSKERLLITYNSVGHSIQNLAAALIAQQGQHPTGPLHSFKGLFQLHGSIMRAETPYAALWRGARRGQGGYFGAHHWQ